VDFFEATIAVLIIQDWGPVGGLVGAYLAGCTVRLLQRLVV